MTFGKIKFKKADINLIFSWIFILVVGAFFIILAYNIIGKYTNNENEKFQIELKMTIRNIFNEFGRTTGTEENNLQSLKNIFKDRKIEIICQDGMSILAIDNDFDANNQYLRQYPTFMTNIEQSGVDWSYLAVENFNMPFKITNLLAIVSQKNLIVIDKESNFGKKLIDKFQKTSYNTLNFIPANFSDVNDNFNLFKTNKIDQKNLNSVIFVTDESKTTDNIEINNLKMESYIIKINELTNNYGTIHYIDKDNQDYNFNYFDYDETLSLQVMATFSRPSVFNCSYNILTKDIVSVYDFYINKTNFYIENSNTSEICIDTYNPENIQHYYSELKDKLQNIQNRVETHKFKNVAVLHDNINSFNTQYDQLTKASCASIY
ncbi:MAG: hypothetical protein ACOC16_03695 [Nanoarchaeota archaeon]